MVLPHLVTYTLCPPRYNVVLPHLVIYKLCRPRYNVDVLASLNREIGKILTDFSMRDVHILVCSAC